MEHTNAFDQGRFDGRYECERKIFDDPSEQATYDEGYKRGEWQALGHTAWLRRKLAALEERKAEGSTA